MVKRSRLGKGLGALFPALPGEEETALGEVTVESAPSTSNDQAAEQQATSKSRAAGKAASATSAQKAKSGGKAAASTAKGKKAAGSGSRANASSKQAAANTQQSVSRETKPLKTRANRMSVPKLSELEHPSDLFFGGSDSASLPTPQTTNVVVPAESASSSQATAKPAAVQVPAQQAQEGPEAALEAVEGGYLAELRVDDIQANAEQPRRIFDEDELLELSRSITEVGLLQPIVVRKLKLQPGEKTDPSAAHYEIIMGERRWRATTLAGQETIPAIVKTTSDDHMLRDALLENLHRVALNPLEEAAAYQQMMDEFGMTQEELSQSVSKSRPQIANMLRLLKLPPSVQKKVESGVLSAGHARALLGLSQPEDMDALANKIIAEGLSVRSTEELVALKTGASSKKTRRAQPNIWVGSALVGNLENHFETKVNIKGSEKKGRIEITYSSPDDMNRILSLLLEEEKPQAKTQKEGDGWV